MGTAQLSLIRKDEFGGPVMRRWSPPWFGKAMARGAVPYFAEARQMKEASESSNHPPYEWSE